MFLKTNGSQNDKLFGAIPKCRIHFIVKRPFPFQPS